MTAAGESNTIRKCDVLVIGGGPAGSTMSALLSQRGWKVTLLEKDRHPRFHIGESLLPLNIPIFERLGVSAEIERIDMLKPGAEFVRDNDEPVVFNFCESIDPTYPTSFQVKRSEFDHVLLRNSAAKGTNVYEECRVTDIDLTPGSDPIVHARDAQGAELRWQPKFVVDASGRDTFLANRLKRKQRNRKHNSSAIFSHFDGAERRSGENEGLISVYWFEHGWFWMIPFKDGGMSVGAVCWPYYLMSRKKNVDEFLMDTIAMCPPVAKRLKHARMTMPALATGNYSYETKGGIGGERFLIIGDAYTFIDPVFSSGVFLAMNGAEMAVPVVEQALNEGGLPRSAVRRYERQVKHGIKIFSWFIYRITTPVMRRMFLAPRNVGSMKAGVLSLLSADLYRNTPIGGPLLMFKLVYYVLSLFSPRETIASFRQRRRAWGSRLDFVWKTGKQSL